MYNSAVLQLQEMSSSSKSDIQELLYKAKMISVKLDLKDIQEWIEYELNGYPNNSDIPTYRMIYNTPIRAFNPYHGWIPYKLADLSTKDAELYEILTKATFPNPVSMLVEYAKSDSSLYCDLPDPISDFLNKNQNVDFRLAWKINPAQIANIISSVRTKILDWSLELEKRNILGDGILFTSEDRSKAKGMTINNIHFHGDVSNSGAIGAGNNGDINQQNNNSVYESDFNSLAAKLKEFGIPESDIDELNNIINNDIAPTSQSTFGDKLSSWMGKVIGKAYSGALNISAASAPTLLTNAICKYFGIPV